MSAKHKYFQFEPAALILEAIQLGWNDKEVGCYWMLICHSYCNGGKLADDMKVLRKLALCHRKFDKVWQKIGHKFNNENGFITQKRVLEEIQRVVDFQQKKSRAGKKGMESRWSSTNPEHLAIGSPSVPVKNNNGAISSAITKEKESESKVKLNLSSRDVSLSDISSSIVFQSETLNAYEKLIRIIKPKSVSDRTGFQRICRWGASNSAGGGTPLGRVFEIAREVVALRGLKNPIAFFMSRLKKELGYGKKNTQN